VLTVVRSQGARLTALAVAVALPAFYAIGIRPRVLAWGASPEEAARPLPGDDLVAGPCGGATMATTLPAPPEDVWPWLVQMGGDRGGWYGWDRLDNNGNPSADRIVAAWQHLSPGQELLRASAPGSEGPSFFVVEIVEAHHTLVLRASYHMLTGRSYDPRYGPVPWAYVDGIWGFHLRATPGGGTRLVVRTRNRSGPSHLARPFNLLLGEPLHLLMQTHQFHNLRTRLTTSA